MGFYKLFFIPFLFVFSSSLYAQQAIVSSANEANGNGGSSAYSIGQTTQNFNQSIDGSANEGINQPYEIFIITGFESENIQLKMSVYPNPASSEVILQILDMELKNLSWSIFDVNGIPVGTSEIQERNSSIPFETSKIGVYFLYVNDANKNLKTFKIIKNK